MKQVAIIGAGTMGNGIAHTFAQCGFNVALIDISEAALKKGMATITKNLDRMITKGKISETDKSNTLSKIHFSHKYLFHFYNAISSSNHKARTSGWNAFYESCTSYETG